MIKTSAVAQARVVGIRSFLFCSFNVRLCLTNLKASTEEIDKLRQDAVVVWSLFQDLLELLYGLLKTIGLIHKEEYKNESELTLPKYTHLSREGVQQASCMLGHCLG